MCRGKLKTQTGANWSSEIRNKNIMTSFLFVFSWRKCQLFLQVKLGSKQRFHRRLRCREPTSRTPAEAQVGAGIWYMWNVWTSKELGQWKLVMEDDRILYRFIQYIHSRSAWNIQKDVVGGYPIFFVFISFTMVRLCRKVCGTPRVSSTSQGPPWSPNRAGHAAKGGASVLEKKKKKKREPPESHFGLVILWVFGLDHGFRHGFYSFYTVSVLYLLFLYVSIDWLNTVDVGPQEFVVDIWVIWGSIPLSLEACENRLLQRTWDLQLNMRHVRIVRLVISTRPKHRQPQSSQASKDPNKLETTNWQIVDRCGWHVWSTQRWS